MGSDSQNSAVRDEAIAAWARIRDNVLCCENGSKIHHNLLYAVDAFFKSTQLSEKLPTVAEVDRAIAITNPQKAYDDGLEDAAACIAALILPRQLTDNRDPEDKLFFEFCDKGAAAIRALKNAAPQVYNDAASEQVWNSPEIQAISARMFAEEAGPKPAESAFPCVVDALKGDPLFKVFFTRDELTDADIDAAKAAFCRNLDRIHERNGE